MEIAAIYHRTANQFAYALNPEDLIINIQTGYDVDRVFIVQGDPYLAGIMGGKEQWQGMREEIVYKKRLKSHIWWTTTLRPPFKRLKYYFELISGDEKIYYFENGFYTEEEFHKNGNDLSYFIVPWMNRADIFDTPNWVNDTVWYQIFPERFANGDPSINPKGTKPWKSEKITGFHDYYGGDLRGIMNRIPYLKDLGISGLYLTPVFEADSNHKYNTKNYKKVDPHFGTNELLRDMVDKCHAAGIRVMLDGVFNHTGVDFFAWQDVLEKGMTSEYFDWYMIDKGVFDHENWKDILSAKRDTRDGRYYSFAFADHMPKLNTSNPKVQKYLLDLVAFWIDEFDIDGLRLDVGNEISHKFLKRLREMTKEKKSDFYLLGEIWHDSNQWLLGDEYDAVMNYPLATAIHNYFIFDNWEKIEFEHSINRCFTMYQQQANDVLFNLLDSHDTNRLMDKVQGDLDLFYQQLAILFTMPGSPCIYYGTEVALEGEHDPDCRRCMPWDEIDAGVYKERIEEVKKLITLRKTHGTFKSRNFHFPNDVKDKRAIEYMKLMDDEVIKVVLNCGEDPVEVAIGGEEKILYARKYAKKKLLPKGVVIYRM